MGKLIRCITSDGAVMISAVDTTDIVETAKNIHDTTAVVTAALGRLLTAATMMGNMMKGEEKPYDLARHEIIDLLANSRRVEFMNKVKKDLYNQSVEMGRIKYYYDETK